MKYLIVILFLSLRTYANEAFSSQLMSDERFDFYVSGTLLDPVGPLIFNSSQSKDILIEFDDKIEEQIFSSNLNDTLLASSLVYTLQNAEYDKRLHYVAGAAIGEYTTKIADIYITKGKHQKLKKFLIGAGSAIIAGVLKEKYDKHSGKGTPDSLDAIYTGVAGTLVSASISFRKQERRIEDFQQLLQER